MRRIDVITLFPEWVESLKGLGVTGRAMAQGTISLHCWNPRDFTEDVHRSVDDRPYGGGPGMVMRPEPLARCIEAVLAEDIAAPVSFLGPQGRVLDHDGVSELAGRARLILLCGRYEGVDERVLQTLVDEEWSIGDYVLSGGEPAAAVVMDAVIRQQPGVLGHEESALRDSFVGGRLDCPHYTRPASWRSRDVPEVLLSGDHARIERWRLAEALHRTRQQRPDLLARYPVSEVERAAAKKLGSEKGAKPSESGLK
ncbi:tRNA (guanosine(37)-N1)-methyltransferase TrmD [Wenzhouxiangella limi]|uniref:tRNA (guanine-N(1)-)-methyltransferase n=1 Tax=Wenzhouxiangella limi TaxID=2707351 RepID=A0A845V2H9_9GAMM|nr:tRNA (guanosine(37)-N1)-methyltransferase TrmD [Wenzhouxiangella limi]NDY94481.1 tRNA (guanosine(37)-N1)-methyltransferase TrmD [Wenzhouxiangella limi]